MKKFTILFCFITYLLNTINTYSQGGLYEVSIEEQISKTSLIIEGKVLSKKSFWDTDQKIIYTLNTIEVYKTFKGQPTSTIDVLTIGGEVGNTNLTASHSLQLNEDEMGTFLLNSSDKALLDDTVKNPQYKPYAGIQGFYKYDLVTNAVANVFTKYKDVENNFYKKIQDITKSKIIEIKKKSLISKTASPNLAPFIDTFTPTTISAGTESVLTITGFTFGTTKGKVQFKDANDGGATYIDASSAQILSWNDTTITVIVPSRAGTGPIRVVDAIGTINTSGGVLTIPYAVINRSDRIQQHYNTNGSGGYTFEMNTDFESYNGGIAKDSFTRAFNSWICATGVNWTFGAAGFTNDVASDGINVISFDPISNELDPGTLGVTYTFSSTCANGSVITELDIIFDDERNWQYGPAAPISGQTDFETVAVHELGHAHSMAHVINQPAIMHYSVASNTQKRILSDDDKNGGVFVQNRSVNVPVCSQATMTSIACPSLSINEEILNEHVSLFPNPTKGEFIIKKSSSINLEKALIYDMSGRLIDEIKLFDSPVQNINLKGLSKGVYFVRIYSETAAITKKIILD